MNGWTALPNTGIPSLTLRVLRCENTGIVISFPNFIAPSAHVRRFVNTPGAPPPRRPPRRVLGMVTKMQPSGEALTHPPEPTEARKVKLDPQPPLAVLRCLRELE